MVARATVTQVVLNYDKWYLKVVVTSQTDRASMTDDPNALGFHHDDRIMAFIYISCTLTRREVRRGASSYYVEASRPGLKGR